MPPGSKLRPALNAAFRRITDTMTGSDGGIGFVALRCLLEQLDKQAAEGDAAAIKLLDIVTQFDRLILVARNERGLRCQNQ